MDKERWRLFHDKSNYINYKNGKFKSKNYTKEEIEEKRKYFENQQPINVDKNRWLYEIKRQFELSDDFLQYPDSGFARLQFILETGHL